MTSVRSDCDNILLKSLDDADFALIEPHLKRVPLRTGDIVSGARVRIRTACFPGGGVVSYDDVTNEGHRVGLGMVGRDGLVGWPALLGCDTSPHEAVVAIGGADAMRIDIARLLAAMQQSVTLQAQLLRFVQAFTIQLGRTLMSNLVDPVERRLARWLLMNHDRVEGDQIALTHRQLGVMLGVRRASVTDALHLIEGEGMIRSGRGHITICDRAALQRLAGEAYGAAEAEYRRLIGDFERR